MTRLLRVLGITVDSLTRDEAAHVLLAREVRVRIPAVIVEVQPTGDPAHAA